MASKKRVPSRRATPRKLKRKPYEAELRALQIELIKLQAGVRKEGHRLLVVFEGRDAAGKGGTILRLMQHLNPRIAKKVALDKPNDKERGQWYFQRYARHFPTAGEIVVFDRSWYNRAGVEHVMGFCTQREYEDFLRTVPEFENMLVTSGITLVKYWLDISRKEQRKRIEARRRDPLKHWKLTPLDDAGISRWDAYTKAKRAMFKRTSLPDAPWTVVRSDDKRIARLHCIRHLLSQVDYKGKQRKVAQPPDPDVVGNALDPRFR